MDDLENLKRKQSQLSGWLSDYKQRSGQLRYVQQSLDLANFQIDVASKIPPSVPETVRSEIIDPFLNTTGFWASFTEASSAKSTALSALSGLALEASGSNVAYQSLSALTVGYSQEVKDWAREKTTSYQDIQKKHERNVTIRDYISRLFPCRLASISTV